MRSSGVPFAALAILLVGPVRAQESVTSVAPGPEYKAGGFYRFLLGSRYRSLWTEPIEVPVLDLATYAGGLTAVARTGGQQTRSLRLRAPDGREFFFRSLDKDPTTMLPPDLRGTIAGSVVKDQTKSALPTAPLVVARLLTAAGILHGDPVIVVLPDDSLLGEFRPVFAGLIGTLEPRMGGSGINGRWGGATEIIDSDSLFARTERSFADRVDARAFLRARLFDLLIGDWDRHRDQWRWARFGESEPRWWQPIPLDRDQAFAKYDGVLLFAARQVAPQLTNFGPGYPGMIGATWNGRELDRRFLVGLDRPVWDSVAAALQAALSDDVIDDAVRALPPAHYRLIGATLGEWLRSRRDRLPEAARRYYRHLARQVDVHATGGADRANVVRHDDGSLTLTIGQEGSLPEFERRFRPGDSREVRLYMGDGPDTVEVAGEGGGVTLRVLGGGGSDLLVDSSRSGRNRFYDDPAGAPRTAGGRRGVDRRPWNPPRSPDPKALPPRDWGSRIQGSVWASGGPDVGVFLGGGVAITRYGFRRLPFARRNRIRAGFATGPGAFRVDYRGEFTRENSGVRTELYMLASGIEVTRFHGFGNETQAPGSDEFYRVVEQQYRIQPLLVLPMGKRWEAGIGPEFIYSSTENKAGRFLATINPYGKGDFGELGLRARLAYDSRDRSTAPTRGVTFEVGGAVHPAWLDVAETFGEAWSVATAYLSPPAPLDPTFAFRVGARKLWGTYPFFDAAFIGDRHTVRLGRDQRYAGDASTYGSAELRLFLVRAKLVVPSDVGIFGLADAGRVYLAGESSNDWHTAFGGGLWIGFLSRANTVSVAAARSDERTRLYFQAGFGF